MFTVMMLPKVRKPEQPEIKANKSNLKLEKYLH